MGRDGGHSGASWIDDYALAKVILAIHTGYRHYMFLVASPENCNYLCDPATLDQYQTKTNNIANLGRTGYAHVALQRVL